MFRRSLVFGLCALFLLTGLLFTFGMNNPAQASEMKVLLYQMANPAQAAEVKVLLNGKELSMDVKPVIENGRTLVPLRAIFEALGAKVDWEGTTGTVTAVKDGTSIKLVIDSTTALKNDEKVKLDVPARSSNGRTLVPLRFVSEALGAQVDWNAAAYTVTITDAPAGTQKRLTVTEYFVSTAGGIEKKTVRVPCPPQRVVVLGAYPAEMIKALGVEKAAIAVDESTKNSTQWPEYALEVPDVGSSFTPSVEKIVALKPDLVIEAFMRPEIRSQLTRAGIPVLKIYGYKTEVITREIRTLGLVFNRQDRADAYAAYIEKHWRTVQERTEKLSSRQKPKVYWEYSTGDWRTGGPGSGLHPLIEWAGGINIAADQGLANPVVSPEWVAAKNPDVIIKYAGRGYAGWTVSDTKKMEELRRELMSRPGLKNTNAVKHGRVYLISDLITCAPRGAAGEYYVAKWLHPELFKDIDPEAVHKEMLAKFYGEELKGIWVYPPLK